MNIHLDNVDFFSNSGPNSFAQKFAKYGKLNGCSFNLEREPDACLSFIETHRSFSDCPLYQRLDGIYFNTRQDYQLLNSNIRRTYEMATGVIFQSQFNYDLITKYFGPHSNHRVIHNGADLEKIKSIRPLQNSVIDGYENVWTCASHWRPHKRLDDNIRYFLQHSGQNDCLVVAGASSYPNAHERVFFVGDLPHEALIALYKRSKYFVHLAWLDHCPNVVVDARASGCRIVCSTAGGTKEIAGDDAVLIEEPEWDFQPLDLYSPPSLDLGRKVKNHFDSELDMNKVFLKYKRFMLNEDLPS